MSETVEITRYPNRRLYDRSQKKYVTLGDIEELVFGGRDVRVRDSKSDEDLTRLILTQIILERHPERLKMFPRAFLHSILRADHLAMDWLTAYFGQAMSYMESIVGASAPPLAPGMDFWRSFTSGPRQPRVSPGDEADKLGADQVVDDDSKGQDESDLKARVAEMERRLKQLEGEHPDE